MGTLSNFTCSTGSGNEKCFNPQGGGGGGGGHPGTKYGG